MQLNQSIKSWDVLVFLCLLFSSQPVTECWFLWRWGRRWGSWASLVEGRMLGADYQEGGRKWSSQWKVERRRMGGRDVREMESQWRSPNCRWTWSHLQGNVFNQPQTQPTRWAGMTYRPSANTTSSCINQPTDHWITKIFAFVFWYLGEEWRAA